MALKLILQASGLLMLLLVLAGARSLDPGRKKKKFHTDASRWKQKIDGWSPWPFLPSPGERHGANNLYPFMIISPPGERVTIQWRTLTSILFIFFPHICIHNYLFISIFQSFITIRYPCFKFFKPNCQLAVRTLHDSFFHV